MWLARILGAVLAVIAFAPPVWASSDIEICEPSWRLFHTGRVAPETTVMLAPSNDTVANMTLLRLQATGQ